MRLDRLLLLVPACWLLGACSMVGTSAPPPAPPTVVRAPSPPGPVRPDAPEAASPETPSPNAPGSSDVTARVVDIALASIGTPYVWGGTGADGFDCSGLIQFAYAQVGILLPRISRAQIGSGTPIVPDPRRLLPGDVLGFSEDGDGATDHVGLYIGAGEFIHSSSGGVTISELENPYWQRRLVAARRIVE